MKECMSVWGGVVVGEGCERERLLLSACGGQETAPSVSFPTGFCSLEGFICGLENTDLVRCKGLITLIPAL